MKKLVFIAIAMIIFQSNILIPFSSDMRHQNSSTFQLKKFEIKKSPIELTQEVSPRGYIEASGRRAALLGTGDGTLECWIYPFKVLRNLRLRFILADKKIELAGEDLAVTIVVKPEVTVITYSHPQFTAKEILFAPIDSQGVVILLDFDTNIPLTVGVEFLPELKPMWPGSLGGQYARWDEDMKAYRISESRRKYAAYIGSPLASRYFSAPAHRLADAPNRFEVDINPEYFQRNYIPIIIAGGPQDWKKAAETYYEILNSIKELYLQTQRYYSDLLQNYMVVETPDKEINLSFQWGKVALNKGFVTNPYLGSGLIAGYGLSGRSERPGFCWFFGGDAFINSLAMNGYGDFEIIKSTLKLFQKYQRDDGKIMHEMSQSASMIPWFTEYPYAFYHADTTPYFIIAMFDYIASSGDLEFLKESWPSATKAYQYCLSTDADGNGLMENSKAGLGAVETGALLQKIKEDIYLAGVWTEALRGMAEMATYLKNDSLAKELYQRYEKAKESLNNLFWNEEHELYSFAITEDGGRIDEVTIWPTIPMVFNLLDAEKAENMLKFISAEEMSTDWGIRMLSRNSELYDPVSYNNGSVWPFLTGFATLAEYNGHRALPAFEHLKQTASLTFDGSQGYITELLSGDYFRPLDTSVPHQLFSTSTWMLAFIRGLLGLKGNAINQTLTLSPHLPSHWNRIKVKNFRIGKDVFNFEITKDHESLQLKMENNSASPSKYSLTFSPALPKGSIIKNVTVNGEIVTIHKEETIYDIHPQVSCSITESLFVKIDYETGFEIMFSQEEIMPGDSTKTLKFISSSSQQDTFSFTLEGKCNTSYLFKIHIPWQDFAIKGAEIIKREDHFTIINISFPHSNTHRYTKHVIEITKKLNP